MLSKRLLEFIDEFDINSVEELLEQYANQDSDEDLGDDIFIAVFDGESLSKFFAAKKEIKMRKINDMFLDEVLAQYEQEKWNTNSTRHKSRNGETHTEVPKFETSEPYIGTSVKVEMSSEQREKLQKVREIDDVITSSSRGERETLQGLKESQNVEKAPIFTYCSVNRNAIEALSLRALYGHKKYAEVDKDWQNFTRVPNADEEYANALMRHSLGIGLDDTDEEHLIAAAWNAVARLEIYFRKKLQNQK